MELHRRHYRLKSAPVVSETDEGVIEAYVSIFGNVDDYGDRVIKGAFEKSIATSGGVWPVVYSHHWSDLPIGKTLKAVETDEGLLVTIQLLIHDSQAAREIYAAMKAGVPIEFSFAYDIKASRVVQEDGDDILELIELDVIEVGPCLIGANRETYLVGVKSHDAALAAARAKASADTPEPPADPAPDGDPNPSDPVVGSPSPDDSGEPARSLTVEQAVDVVRYLAIPA